MHARAMPTGRARIGRSRRRVWIGVAVVLALGIASELGLRFWAHHYRVEFERYDPTTGTYRLIPGVYASDSGGEIHINARGLRGPELLDPGDDLIRIAALGDKTVNVSVVARLINQRELEAQIGGSVAGVQTELVN